MGCCIHIHNCHCSHFFPKQCGLITPIGHNRMGFTKHCRFRTHETRLNGTNAVSVLFKWERAKQEKTSTLLSCFRIFFWNHFTNRPVRSLKAQSSSYFPKEYNFVEVFSQKKNKKLCGGLYAARNIVSETLKVLPSRLPKSTSRENSPALKKIVSIDCQFIYQLEDKSTTVAGWDMFGTQGQYVKSLSLEITKQFLLTKCTNEKNFFLLAAQANFSRLTINCLRKMLDNLQVTTKIKILLVVQAN